MRPDAFDMEVRREMDEAQAGELAKARSESQRRKINREWNTFRRQVEGVYPGLYGSKPWWKFW